MAMPSGDSAEHPKPEVVGRTFVEKYYNALHESPENVHKFFLDTSVLTRPDSNGVMTSVTTLDAINDLILSLESQNYYVQLETVDSQLSWGDGVFILVTGYIKGNSDGVSQKFTQSFFVAPQGKGGSYYVLNDVFRYVNNGQQEDTVQSFVDDSNADTVESPVTSDQDSPVVKDNVVEDANPPYEANLENSNPSENNRSVVEEEVAEDQPAHSGPIDVLPVSDTAASVPQGDVPKLSYASIVKAPRPTTSHLPVHVPTAKARPAAAKTSVALTKPVVTSVPAPACETPAASNNTVVENNSSQDVKGHSIYIKNLPLSATAVQVEEVFKRFGTIKPGGVQVRNHKIDPFCFGFVEFDLLTSMQAAIEASPIKVEGRPVFIEEKKTTTRVINGVASVGIGGGSGNGRGGYPPRRGGYQNNSYRGRGSFSGNRNFARGNFRQRVDYENRGDYQNQGDYQNRGRDQAGRSSEAYQQRVIDDRLNQPNGASQSHEENRG